MPRILTRRERSVVIDVYCRTASFAWRCEATGSNDLRTTDLCSTWFVIESTTGQSSHDSSATPAIFPGLRALNVTAFLVILTCTAASSCLLPDSLFLSLSLSIYLLYLSLSFPFSLSLVFADRASAGGGRRWRWRVATPRAVKRPTYLGRDFPRNSAAKPRDKRDGQRRGGRGRVDRLTGSIRDSLRCCSLSLLRAQDDSATPDLDHGGRGCATPDAATPALCPDANFTIAVSPPDANEKSTCADGGGGGGSDDDDDDSAFLTNDDDEVGDARKLAS